MLILSFSQRLSLVPTSCPWLLATASSLLLSSSISSGRSLSTSRPSPISLASSSARSLSWLRPSTVSSVSIRRPCSIRRQLLPSPSVVNGASLGKKQGQSNSSLGLWSMDHGYHATRNSVKEHHQESTEEVSKEGASPFTYIIMDSQT